MAGNTDTDRALKAYLPKEPLKPGWTHASYPTSHSYLAYYLFFGEHTLFADRWREYQRIKGKSPQSRQQAHRRFPEFSRETESRIKNAWLKSGEISMASLEEVFRVMDETGEIARLDPRGWIAPQPLTSAIAELRKIDPLDLLFESDEHILTGKKFHIYEEELLSDEELYVLISKIYRAKIKNKRRDSDLVERRIRSTWERFIEIRALAKLGIYYQTNDAS